MANPYYIQPAGDYSQGLAGIGDVLKDIGEQKRLRQEQDAMRQAEEASIIEADEALRSGDPDKIRLAALKNPKLGQTILAAHGADAKSREGEIVGLYRDILSTDAPAKDVIEKQIMQRRALGKDTKDLEAELMDAQDDAGYKLMARAAFAGLAPKESEIIEQRFKPKDMPKTREYERDGVKITEEFDPATGQFKEIATSPIGSGTFGGKRVQSAQILEDGTTVMVMSDGTTKAVDSSGNELSGADRERAVLDAQDYGAKLQGLRSGERTAGSIGPREGQKAFESLGKVYKNIGNLDDAIAAIDKGANTGVIASKFPSLFAGAIELDNIQRRLGLDVVGSVTFGALSEGELQLALETALPTNLDQPQLKQWLVEKKAAQGKLADYLSEQAAFLSKPGNTLDEWINQNQGRNPSTKDAKSIQDMSDDELFN